MRSSSTMVIDALVLLLAILGPFAFIWALNTLFPQLAIPVAPETWLAVAVILGLTRENISKKD